MEEGGKKKEKERDNRMEKKRKKERSEDNAITAAYEEFKMSLSPVCLVSCTE